MARDPFLKALFSPIGIIVISVFFVSLESWMPFKKIPTFDATHGGSWFELLLFYYFYALSYHAYFFIKRIWKALFGEVDKKPA